MQLICVFTNTMVSQHMGMFPNATKPKLKVSNNANKDYSAIEANSTEERYLNDALL